MNPMTNPAAADTLPAPCRSHTPRPARHVIPAELTPSIPPSAPPAYHTCSCGTAYGSAVWSALPRKEWRIAGDILELADCIHCGSTMSVKLGEYHEVTS